MINWEDLSQQTRDYFDSRFANHGMDGETAFNHSHIIPYEAREELDSNGIEQLLRDNEISHIMPQAHYPDLSSDYNNIVLESEELNRLRSDEIMTDAEVNLAKKDILEDVDDLESDLSLLDDIPEILAASTTLGVVHSLNDANNKIKDGTIELDEAPQYVIEKVGGRIVKAAIIGTCLTSGAPVLVAAAGGYLINKNKKLLDKIFSGVLNVVDFVSYVLSSENNSSKHNKNITYEDSIVRFKRDAEVIAPILPVITPASMASRVNKAYNLSDVRKHEYIKYRISSKVEDIPLNNFPLLKDYGLLSKKDKIISFNKKNFIGKDYINPYCKYFLHDQLLIFKNILHDTKKYNLNSLNLVFDEHYFKHYLVNQYFDKTKYYLQSFITSKNLLLIPTVFANTFEKRQKLLKTAFNQNFNKLSENKNFKIIEKNNQYIFKGLNKKTNEIYTYLKSNQFFYKNGLNVCFLEGQDLIEMDFKKEDIKTYILLSVLNVFFAKSFIGDEFESVQMKN